MISKASTVDAFLASLPAAERAVFAQLRDWLRTGSPRIAESMAYGMPSYKLGDEMVGAFNRQKNYLCLYLKPAAIDPHRKTLKAAGLDCGKSCIRFKRPDALPLDLARTMIAAAIELGPAASR